MSMKCEEAQELITALVDHELSSQERPSIEDHLKECPKCQSVYEQEQALKREIQMVGASVHAPSDLKERILSDQRTFPDGAESTEGWKRLLWPKWLVLRPALVLALLLILVLPALYLMQSNDQPISLAALETHERFLSSDISFVKAESKEQLIKRLVRSVTGRFAPMGYDLSAMNLQPVGGIVQEAQGRKILVVLYEGEGDSITCYTFPGTDEDAPEDAVVVFDPEKKINFYTFSRNGVNGVFHREGELICILVSKMPMADLVALARSKARPI